MHTAFLRALLHLYVLHRLSFCFFVCLSSPLFSIINFPLRSSLSPHFTNSLRNGPSVFFLSVLFFSSVQLTPHISDIPSSPKSSNRTNVKSGVSALSSTSNAFGTVASNARLDQTGNGHIDEALRQQALAEEEAAMNQYKAKVQSPSSTSTNPFLSSPTNNANQPIVDLFGTAMSENQQQQLSQKASDDLLQLAGNPFANMFGTPQPAAPGAQSATQNNMWMTNGTDNSFSSVFGNQDQQSTGVPGTAASVPNPFMSDFPSLGTAGGQQTATNAGAFGFFDQNAGGGVVGGNAMNESAQATTAPGGDLFSAGQADLFAGGDGSAAMLKTATNSDGDAAAAEVVASTAPSAVGKISSTATPPPRPPPPATAVAAANVGAAPRALSPTISGVGGVSHGRPAAATAAASGPPANKSAFDDLNDSIRMALGGSPSRPAPMVQQQAAMTTQQQPLQQQMPPAGAGIFSGMNDAAGQQSMMTGAPMVGYGIPTQAQVPVGYGSPAKQPMSAAGQPVSAAATGKVLTGDLDSSLASLAQNLTINKSGQQQVKGMQWNSPKNAAKTGGSAGGWSPQPMAATTGAGYRPMGMQGMPMGMQGMQGMQGMRPMMCTIPGASAAGGGMMVAGGAAPMMTMPGANPMMTGPNLQQQQQPQSQPQAVVAPTQPQGNAVQLDPFGAL